MRETRDEAFRAIIPLSRSDNAPTAPKIIERSLANGIRVLFVERHDVPIVALRVVSDRGADQADPGIAEFWVRAALRAGKQYTYWEVSEAWNDLGVHYTPSATTDATQIELRVLSKLLEPTTLLLGKLVAQPVFPPGQVKLMGQRLHAQLTATYASAEGQMDLAVHDFFYPRSHPYHEPYAPPESISKVNGGILELYQSYAFTPAHMTLAVAGDTTVEALLPLLEKAFGTLTGPTVGAQPVPPPPPLPAPDPRFLIIDRPGTQALVTAAWLGPARDADDRIALWLAEGELETRLFTRLRADLGITYGVRVASKGSRGRLPLSISSEVEVSRVKDAVTEIVAAVTRAAKEPISDDDLALDRATVSNTSAYFDSARSTARTLAHLAVYRLPLDFYQRRADAIKRTTAEEVRRASERWMPADKMMFVIVGDAATLRPQLTQLGLGAVAWRMASTF